MNYNINYCIISAIYLLFTAFFYGRQNRVHSRRSRLFDAMLWCGVISLLLDIAAAVIDRCAAACAVWIIYLVNIIFLLSVQLSGALLFQYAMSITGIHRRIKLWVRLLIRLPVALAAAAILASPITQQGAFYLDETHIYRHGAAHLVLYAAVGTYLIASLVLVFVQRKRLQKLKFYTILAFLLVTLAAMLVQMNYPYLLVNSMANALALTLMYHILEAPDAHVDALTGAMNRSALPIILRDIFNMGERSTLIVFMLNSLHNVNHSFGMQGGDEALIAYSNYLKQRYPRQQVLRVEGDVLSVLFAGGDYVDEQRLQTIYDDTQTDFTLEAGEVQLDTVLACINSEDCASFEEMCALFESVLQQHRIGEEGGILFTGGAFKEELKRREAIELATERALDEGRVEVYYQPIHNSAGRLCALEALVRIHDETLGFLPPQELVELAERSGNIVRLGAEVLRRTCAFIRDNRVESWGLDHVGVNLSAIQCVRRGLPGEIGRILEAYGIPEGLIAFEVTETAVGALSVVRENMEEIRAQGSHFLLDDFGTGYANFQNMAVLPFHCIKIDKSLLWSAKDSAENMKLLSGVCRIVHTLGLTSLCEGVETAEHVALLKKLGVSMMQGYYYAKPLPPEQMLDYARKEGVC